MCVVNVVCVYLQILPDYRKGLLNVLPDGKVSDQQFHQISKLAALQHRAKDIVFVPSMWANRHLFSVYRIHPGPKSVFHLLTPLRLVCLEMETGEIIIRFYRPYWKVQTMKLHRKWMETKFTALFLSFVINPEN